MLTNGYGQARMFKTRTLATSAAKAGHVKINGNVAKSSTKVKSGDNVIALTPGGKRILEVIALAELRGPATFAQTLYVDHTPEPEPDIAPLVLNEVKVVQQRRIGGSYSVLNVVFSL